MGHKHTKEDILQGALDTAFAEGLSRLSFGRVAKHLGISDRVVVYYFPTKAELVTEVVANVGLQLQAELADALTGSIPDHLAMLRKAWPVLADPEADRVFALFFEANGLASSGHEPYDSLVPMIVQAWIEWLEGLFDCPVEQRRTEAEATIALIDGLVLFRQLAGPEAADRAATRLGVL